MSLIFCTSKPFSPFGYSDFGFSIPVCYLCKKMEKSDASKGETHVNVKLCSEMDLCSELSFYEHTNVL